MYTLFRRAPSPGAAHPWSWALWSPWLANQPHHTALKVFCGSELFAKEQLGPCIAQLQDIASCSLPMTRANICASKLTNRITTLKDY